MRKRSKKRISQDVLPWIRIQQRDEGTLNLFNKKATRWISGNRRNWNTTLLNNQIQQNLSKNIIKSFLMNRKFISRQVLDEKKNIKTKSFFTEEKENKLSARFKKSGYSKTKNFCLFLGKGRTYNRKIFISRQIFRKLLRLNNLIGFQK